MTETNKNIHQEAEQEITLIDDQGNEELYQVLFTFDSEDYGKSYVLLYPASSAEDEEVDIQAFAFTSDVAGDASQGDLFPIEDDEEWEMVEEVINTFVEDEENAD